MYRNMNWRGFILILCIILAIFLPLHFSMKGQRSEKEQRITSSNAKLAQLEEDNQKLAKKLENIGTNEYIAQIAIEKYDFHSRSDIRFEIVNPEALNLYTDEEFNILFHEMAE